MKGYRTLAWGLFLAIVPGALSYLAGVHWADYVSPELAFIITGGITILLRGITDTPLGSDLPKKLFALRRPALGFALLLGTGEVRAADMPVKAPTRRSDAEGSWLPISASAPWALAREVNANTARLTNPATGNLNATGGAVGAALATSDPSRKIRRFAKWQFGESW